MSIFFFLYVVGWGGGGEGEGRYEDKFIQIPIENSDLIRHVGIVIDS